MKLRPLTGTITALATPFRDGQVSYADLKKLVAHQIKGGINGLVPVSGRSFMRAGNAVLPNRPR